MSLVSNTPLKKAINAEAHKDYRLYVRMEDNEKLDLDLTPLITSRESFWRLKNFRYFRKVAVDPLGGLCWPGGEDISPGRILYYAAGKPKDSQDYPEIMPI